MSSVGLATTMVDEQWTMEDMLQQCHVFSFSSNWLEPRTLCQIMEDPVDRTPDVVRGTPVFYFTDNSTVYYAVNKCVRVNGTPKTDRTDQACGATTRKSAGDDPRPWRRHDY
jgi:hypothetical protein